LEVAEESCFMLGQCSKNARAKKPCDHRRFMPGCPPHTSAFFWPHDSRMLLLPSSVATTRSSCAAENSQPVRLISLFPLGGRRVRCWAVVRPLSCRAPSHYAPSTPLDLVRSHSLV